MYSKCQYIELDEDGEEVESFGCMKIPMAYPLRLISASGRSAVYIEVYLCPEHINRDSYGPDIFYDMDSDFQWGGF